MWFCLKNKPHWCQPNVFKNTVPKGIVHPIFIFFLIQVTIVQFLRQRKFHQVENKMIEISPIHCSILYWWRIQTEIHIEAHWARDRCHLSVQKVGQSNLTWSCDISTMFSFSKKIHCGCHCSTRLAENTFFNLCIILSPYLSSRQNCKINNVYKKWSQSPNTQSEE